MFVLAYKILRALFSRLLGKSFLSFFLAGAGASLLLNRAKTPVRYQIVLYLLSRVLSAGVSMLREKRGEQESVYDFRWGAAAAWGTVMLLFAGWREHLQPSLTASM
jgi:hypothetical protein